MAKIERIEIALGKKLPKPVYSTNETITSVPKTTQSFFGVPAIMIPPQEQIDALRREANNGLAQALLNLVFFGVLIYSLYSWLDDWVKK